MSKDIMKNCITCTCTREHTSLVKFNVQTTPHNQILSLRRKQPFLSCVGFHSSESGSLMSAVPSLQFRVLQKTAFCGLLFCLAFGALGVCYSFIEGVYWFAN